MHQSSKIFTDTSEKTLEMLTDIDTVKYQNVLRSLSYKIYKPILLETESSRNKYTKNRPNEQVKEV